MAKVVHEKALHRSTAPWDKTFTISTNENGGSPALVIRSGDIDVSIDLIDAGNTISLANALLRAAREMTNSKYASVYEYIVDGDEIPEVPSESDSATNFKTKGSET